MRSLYISHALDDLIGTGMVLVGIGLFVLEELAEAVVTSSEETTKPGANPVDVVCLIETGSSNARTERASGVKTASGVVDT